MVFLLIKQTCDHTCDNVDILICIAFIFHMDNKTPSLLRLQVFVETPAKEATSHSLYTPLGTTERLVCWFVLQQFDLYTSLRWNVKLNKIATFYSSVP